MQYNEDGLRAARRFAQWYIGDSEWADSILSAYFHPEDTQRLIDKDRQS